MGIAGHFDWIQVILFAWSPTFDLRDICNKLENWWLNSFVNIRGNCYEAVAKANF